MNVRTAWATSMLLISAAAMAADTPEIKKPAPNKKTVNHVLNGDYAFASTELCSYASDFGPPPMLQPIGELSLENSVMDGVLTLDGKGGGSLRARLGSSGTAPWFARPLLSQLSCKVKYRVTSDSALELERECEGLRAMGTGSQTASQWSASPAVLTGHVRGDVLSFTDTRQAVERYVIFGGTAQRICNRIGTATKIKALE